MFSILVDNMILYFYLNLNDFCFLLVSLDSNKVIFFVITIFFCDTLWFNKGTPVFMLMMQNVKTGLPFSHVS